MSPLASRRVEIRIADVEGLGIRIVDKPDVLAVEMTLDSRWDDVLESLRAYGTSNEIEELRCIFEEPNYPRTFINESLGLVIRSATADRTVDSGATPES